MLAIALIATCAAAAAKPPLVRVQLDAPSTQEATEPPPAPPSYRARRAVETLSDAVRRIERATRGQVLSAERLQFDGRNVHRVKVLDDRGRVRVYTDDPRALPTRRDDGDDPTL